MRIALLPISAVAILLAASASAQQPTQKASDEPAKMVCKKFQSTGTRLRNRRVCASATEWAQREAQDQASLRAFRGRMNGEKSERIGNEPGRRGYDNVLATMQRGI